MVLAPIAAVFLFACQPAGNPPGTTTTTPRDALAFYPDKDKNATHRNLSKLEFNESAAGVFDDYLPCDTSDENCDGAAEVRIKIIPEERSQVGPMEAALKRASGEESKGGYVVAKVINMDSQHRFGPFNLEKGETAYLWAGPTRQKGNRFAIYRIPDGQDAVALASADTAAICRRGTYGIPAVHSPAPYCAAKEPIYAHPRGPSAALTPGRNYFFLASNPIVSPALVSAVMHLQGLWISCAGGCCQASGWAPM